MPCCRVLLETCTEIPVRPFEDPVVLLEISRASQQTVCVVKTIQEELLIQIVTRMVRSPDAFLMLGHDMRIHTNKEPIVLSQYIGPELHLSESFGPVIIAQN